MRVTLATELDCGQAPSRAMRLDQPHPLTRDGKFAYDIAYIDAGSCVDVNRRKGIPVSFFFRY